MRAAFISLPLFIAPFKSTVDQRYKILTMAQQQHDGASCTTTTSPQSDQHLLPILAHALPTIISYTIPSDSKVVQANAEVNKFVCD